MLNVLTGDTFDARVLQNGPDEFRVAFVPFHSGSYKLDVSILDKPLGLHEFQVKPREKPQGIIFVYDFVNIIFSGKMYTFFHFIITFITFFAYSLIF